MKVDLIIFLNRLRKYFIFIDCCHGYHIYLKKDVCKSEIMVKPRKTFSLLLR